MAQLHSLDKILDKGEGPRLGYVVQETLTWFGEYCKFGHQLHFKAGISWSVLKVVNFKLSPYLTEMKWNYLIPKLFVCVLSVIG